MTPENEAIVHRLSQQPQTLYKGMISVTGRAEFRVARRIRKHPSSLGRLESLPIELLTECMLHMDLLSLLRLSGVCTRGAQLVESHRSLWKFLAVVDNFPLVLAKAKILGLHSLATLLATLHSEKCVSCGAYGPFFHLLLAQRCCYACLDVNQSLWVMSVPKAQKCFGLSNRDIGRLDVMWSVPGSYGSRRQYSRKKSSRLVSVRAAKELAVAKHRTFKKFQLAHPLDENFEIHTMEWYRQAPLQSLSQDPLTIDQCGHRGRNVWEGMMAVHFPSLQNGQIEYGRGCLGCERALTRYLFEEPDQEMLARMVPPGCDLSNFFDRVEFRSWSAAGLVDHARSCHPDEIEKLKI